MKRWGKGGRVPVFRAYGMLVESCLSVALIVIVHVIAPIVVLGQIVAHRQQSMKARLPMILGLIYYGAVGVVACVLVNPFMLWELYVVESFRFMLTGFTK
jgi:hypothetical protein